MPDHAGSSLNDLGPATAAGEHPPLAGRAAVKVNLQGLVADAGKIFHHVACRESLSESLFCLLAGNPVLSESISKANHERGISLRDHPLPVLSLIFMCSTYWGEPDRQRATRPR